MKKFITILICMVLLFFSIAPKSIAVADPLAYPNNKFGIHILFPSEISKAANLVNSNGGDWGYVVIPIQAGDKDLVKWQNFMDDCRKYHIIPILRISTEDDYFHTVDWRKPTDADVVDFANFLTSLSWPTKNRYVIIFNEVNRGDEWGGSPNAAEYANLLSYAVSVFKSRNPDFFIISAGMDNGAANANNAINEYTYYQEMNAAVPGIFSQIDGFASHSYPNPAFTQPPLVKTPMSDWSFSYEEALLDSLSNKKLPVFITETGWSQTALGQQTAASYLKDAYTSVWTDPNIVAITPFLLEAGGGPFEQFSFTDGSGNPNPLYQMLASLPKIKGQPPLTSAVLAAHTVYVPNMREETFTNAPLLATTITVPGDVKLLFKWLLHFPIQ